MAIRFDASGESVSRTANLPAIDAFTIMGWFRLVVDTNNYQSAIAFGDTTGFDYLAWGPGADGTTLNLYDGDDDQAGSALSLNTWYHLALTCAGSGAGQLIGYLNGVADVTGDTTLGGIAAETLFIGNDSFDDLFNGRAAAVKVYGAVLTAAQIRQEMWTYLPRRWANLNAFYPMFGGATERLRDYYQGRNFTANGTLTDEAGPPGVAWDAAIPTGTKVTVSGPAGEGSALTIAFPSLTAQGTHSGTGSGLAHDGVYTLAGTAKGGLASAFVHDHPYVLGEGQKTVIGGTGFAFLAALPRVTLQGIKGGLGFMDGWEEGILYVEGRKGTVGFGFTAGRPRVLAEGEKGGTGAAFGHDAPYALGEGSKGGQGFGLNLDHPFFEAFGVKAGGGVVGEGFAFVRGHGYLFTLGEHAGTGYALDFGPSRIRARGIKLGTGSGFSFAHPFVLVDGRKSGEAFGFDPAFTLAHSVKGSRGAALAFGHARVLADGTTVFIDVFQHVSVHPRTRYIMVSRRG